jgi:excinuclease ABC subunit B
VGRSNDAEYITEEYLAELEAEMMAAADALEFERAASIRDRIERMRDSLGRKVVEVDRRSSSPNTPRRRGRGGRLPRPKR